jgi:hypothetical protein
MCTVMLSGGEPEAALEAGKRAMSLISRRSVPCPRRTDDAPASGQPFAGRFADVRADGQRGRSTTPLIDTGVAEALLFSGTVQAPVILALRVPIVVLEERGSSRTLMQQCLSMVVLSA